MDIDHIRTLTIHYRASWEMVAKCLTEAKNDTVSPPFLTSVINKRCILVFNSEKVNIKRVKNKIGVKKVTFQSKAFWWCKYGLPVLVGQWRNQLLNRSRLWSTSFANHRFSGDEIEQSMTAEVDGRINHKASITIISGVACFSWWNCIITIIYIGQDIVVKIQRIITWLVLFACFDGL